MIPEYFNPEMLVLARRSRNLTQAALVKLSQVHRNAVSRYEAGTQIPNHDVLERLANTLNYPVHFFYRKSPLIGMAGGAIFHRKQQSLSVGQLYQAHALAEIRRLEVMALLNSLGVEERPIPEYPVELFDDDPEKNRTLCPCSNEHPSWPDLQSHGDFGAEWMCCGGARLQLTPDRWFQPTSDVWTMLFAPKFAIAT